MKIFIKEFTFETVIGILDFERTEAQKVLLNIEIEYTYTQGSFIDYVAIMQQLQEHFRNGAFYLIEDALLSSIEYLKHQYPAINAIEMEIFKPNIVKNANVGAKYSKKF